MTLWSVQWRSRSKLSGARRHLIYREGLPVLFRTRSKARAFIAKEYGYIARRKGLRAEPHGWRMPRPVRVRIVEEKD
ncbi:MAG TPA: hypothetical protein VFU31_20955 [Candidatus Binatia bacterium]|nr:hypothetical protein [Candidatus Binatia bacterium]